jgi:ParB family chromosome partitioning protein
MTDIADALAGALGREVRVRPRGAGYKVELAVESADDAAGLAARLARRERLHLPARAGD